MQRVLLCPPIVLVKIESFRILWDTEISRENRYTQKIKLRKQFLCSHNNCLIHCFCVCLWQSDIMFKTKERKVVKLICILNTVLNAGVILLSKAGISAGSSCPGLQSSLLFLLLVITFWTLSVLNTKHFPTSQCLSVWPLQWEQLQSNSELYVVYGWKNVGGLFIVTNYQWPSFTAMSSACLTLTGLQMLNRSEDKIPSFKALMNFKRLFTCL